MLVLIVACFWGDACSHSGLYLGLCLFSLGWLVIGVRVVHIVALCVVW